MIGTETLNVMKKTNLNIMLGFSLVLPREPPEEPQPAPGGGVRSFTLERCAAALSCYESYHLGDSAFWCTKSARRSQTGTLVLVMHIFEPNNLYLAHLGPRAGATNRMTSAARALLLLLLFLLFF